MRVQLQTQEVFSQQRGEVHEEAGLGLGLAAKTNLHPLLPHSAQLPQAGLNDQGLQGVHRLPFQEQQRRRWQGNLRDPALRCMCEHPRRRHQEVANVDHPRRVHRPELI